MKITSIGNLIAFGAAILLTIVLMSEWKAVMNRPRDRMVLVKIPPAAGAETQSARRFWAFQEPLFPYEDLTGNRSVDQKKLIEPLRVSLMRDGAVFLGTDAAGNLEDLRPLRRAVAAIFVLRRDFRVVNKADGRPMHGIVLSAPKSSKYGEVCKIVDVLKELGADPIVLQIDGLPNYSGNAYGR